MEHPDLRGFGDWRLLARGGLALVWEARQLSLDRLVAVKVYPAESEEGDRRFLREIAAAGGLSDHPAIVTAHDAGILPDDRPYLVMKLCPGGSLARWLEPENRPGEEQVRQVGVRIAAALAAVHAHGLFHRDIRPANILLDSYGNPGLSDFGLASLADTPAAGAPPVSRYAPPEPQTSERADVYSLAATLYALLTGRPPRRPDAAPAADPAGSSTDPSPVNQHLMKVLLTALSIDPAARPTAATFRDQLALVGASAPDPQLRSGAVHAQVPQRHGKRARGLVALAAALVAVTAPVAIWLADEPPSSGASAATTQSATAGEPSSEAEPSRIPGLAPTSAADATVAPGPAGDATIQLTDPVDSAKPFQTVLIQGRYRGGAETFLRVQRWEKGSWLAFPIPTKTDRSGQFTAYVELGRPGRYRLRVLDPDSGTKSQPTVLVIKG